MEEEENTGTDGGRPPTGGVLPVTTDSQLQYTQRSKGARGCAQSTGNNKWRESWATMTGAGRTMKTKPHLHTITPRDHTMANVITRAARLQAKQSGDANMINAREAHTPQRMRGTNGATPMKEGVTVTPPAAKNDTDTAGQNGEEESDDGEALTTAMEVEAPSTTDAGKAFSLTAAKGNKDADAETAEDGCTNDKARPETTDVEPATTDGEA